MRGAARGVVGVTRPPGRQKHLLDHLFCVAQIAQNSVGQTDCLTVMGVIQEL